MWYAYFYHHHHQPTIHADCIVIMENTVWYMKKHLPQPLHFSLLWDNHDHRIIIIIISSSLSFDDDETIILWCLSFEFYLFIPRKCRERDSPNKNEITQGKNVESLVWHLRIPVSCCCVVVSLISNAASGVVGAIYWLSSIVNCPSFPLKSWQGSCINGQHMWQ